MNMWLEYLKECLFDEIDIVLNLAGIDQLKKKKKNEVNDIISLLNDNIENLSFYNIKDEELLLDGNPWVLIKVLNDLVEKKNRVVVTKTNLAINKWIIESYKDFLVDNGANCNVDIEIADNFEMKKSTIIIGHKEFVKEMEECLNVDVQTIVEEF